MKKNIIAITVFCCFGILSATVSAKQTTTTQMIIDDRYWSSETQKCVEGVRQECRPCAGTGTIACNAGCVQVIQNCGATMATAKKTASAVNYSRVRRMINTAMAAMVSQETFDKAMKEIQDELDAIKKRLDDLEGRMVKVEERQDRQDAEIVVVKATADLATEKNNKQDEKLSDHENRISALEGRVDGLDLKVDQAYNKIRFSVGALGLASRGIYGGGVIGGLDFAMTQRLRVGVDAGIGGTADGLTMILAKGGPFGLLGEKKIVGLGLEALFIKEGLTDYGNAHIGAGPNLRVYLGKHGLISLFGAVGTTTWMKHSPTPQSPARLERTWDLGWAVGISGGASF